jgi:Predicted permease
VQPDGRKPDLYGIQLKEIPDLISSGVVITRLMRGSDIFTPNGKTIIEEGDKVHIVGMPDAVAVMEKIIGKRLEKPITQFASDTAKPIQVKTILVTNKKVLGRTIGSLALAERYGVNVSRVVRSGFKFTGRLDLRIKFADKLMVVGPARGLRLPRRNWATRLRLLTIPKSCLRSWVFSWVLLSGASRLRFRACRLRSSWGLPVVR